MTSVLTRRAPVGLLLIGFTLAVWLRVAVGGVGVAQSARAGLVFAVVLALLSLAVWRPRLRATRRALAAGLLVGGLLCVPVLLTRGFELTPGSGFPRWAVVVAVVALAEEVFLRGALYEAVDSGWGADAAIVVAAVAFAALHVPLYGWHVVPLDLVVGLVLGELRRGTGSVAAPAVAHISADWAAWFLR